MTLQFNPAPYLEAFQYGQNRDAQARQQETQGIQGIGQGIGQLAQIPAQQKQDRMNQFLMGIKLKEQNIDPTNGMNWVNTGQYPQQGSASSDQTSQPSPMPFLSQNTAPTNSLSDMQPSNIPPQEPGGFSDRMNGTGESPIVTAHKQVLMDPNHPYKPQAQQQGMSSLFQSPNVDYGKIVSSMDQGDYSGYQGLNEKQRGDVEKIREYNSTKADRQSKDKELQDYRNQMLDLQRNRLDITESTKPNQQQDKLEKDYRGQILSLRGDKSLQNIETQRDAATMAYNRIKQIEATGKPMNPIDYVDILGQVYKARTGAAPTNEVLQSAKQGTAQGDLGKWYTYFTGQQAPATSQAIQDSLKDMVGHMGQQADDMHDAYMAPHLLAPTGLDETRAERIRQTARGKSFRDATGFSQQQGGGQQIGRFKVVVH